jgi:HPt (histidine-containing phosphotransfer) domain-containing protein
LAAGDRHAAHALVHTLKGIAGLIGARHIATLTSDIIEGLRAGGDLAAIQSQAQACEVALASLGKSVQGLSAYSPVT